MPNLTKDPKSTLNVVKLFADLPQNVIVFLNELEIPQGKSMSSFLASHLECYLANQSGYPLKRKDILLIQQLPGVEYNNFCFYANKQLIEKLEQVASHNIRNRKEQTTFFLFALYCKLVGNAVISVN
jgi:hypothetical protein